VSAQLEASKAETIAMIRQVASPTGLSFCDPMQRFA